MAKAKVITHDYVPNLTPAKFHACPKRYKGLKGSKGSAKTRTLIEECWLLAHEYPGNTGVVARKDYTGLERTTMKYFLDWMPQVVKVEFNQMKRRLTVRTKDPNRPSTIYFVQEKEPMEFESLELGFFAIDEGDECPQETFKTLQSRLRLKGVPHFGMIAFNPPHRRHWLHGFFVDDIKKDPSLAQSRELFENNTYENAAHLPAGYIDQLKDIYSGDDLNRYLYGEWGSTTSDRAVIPGWRESLHIANGGAKFVTGLPIIRAWDFGMMAGALLGQMVGKRLNVLKEISGFNMGAEQFAPKVLAECVEYGAAKFIDLSDPTFIGNRSQVDAKSIKSVMKELFNISMLDGAINFNERVGSVNYFLEQLEGGKACLQVDESCQTLIAGFEGGYVFSERAVTRNAADVEDNEYTALQDCLQHMAWYARRKLQKQQIVAPIQREEYDFGGYEYSFK